MRIDFIGDNAESDQAIGIVHKPLESSKTPRTRTGERRDNADAAAHMQINFCPDQGVLKRCARCRLVDPDNNAMSFWVISDTRDAFHSSMISRFELSGFYTPEEGDIWVWVSESLTTVQRKQANPPPFQIPDGEKTFAVIHKEDVAETPYVAVKATCYSNTTSQDPSPGYRRTGFFVMKDLRYA